MPPRPGRTARKPAEDRRREIADAALHVIAAQGRGRFTALAIAEEVGLSDAALFRHFPTKDAIVDAAIDRVEELLFEGFPPVDPDPIVRLGAFFRRRIAVIREHPGISPLVVSEELAKEGSPGALERVAGFRRRSMAFVRSCLAEADRDGLLAPGLRGEEACVVVLGSILALAHSSTAPGPEAIAGLAPRVWAALERLLRGSPTRAQSAGHRPPRPTGRTARRGQST
jgi:AcrR family transcriptional regulator